MLEENSSEDKEALMLEIQGAIWEVADKKEIAQLENEPPFYCSR